LIFIDLTKHISNLKYLGGNAARKVLVFLLFYTLYLFFRTLLSSVLEMIAKSSHAEASVLYKVLGSPRTTLATSVV
jgi:hypothetical protein